MGRAWPFIEVRARIEAGSCSLCSAASSRVPGTASAATAVVDAPRNSRRVGMPYNTAMALHRVSVMGGTDSQARDEFLAAGAARGRLLASGRSTGLFFPRAPVSLAQRAAALPG